MAELVLRQYLVPGPISIISDYLNDKKEQEAKSRAGMKAFVNMFSALRDEAVPQFTDLEIIKNICNQWGVKMDSFQAEIIQDANRIRKNKSELVEYMQQRFEMKELEVTD